MLLDIVKKGTTDYSVFLRVVDAADGTPVTDATFESTGIDLWYRRPQSAHTSITEATQTESGAHSDGGFVHVSDGMYRLDLPDAALASGVDYVDVGGTITDCVVIGGRIRLVDNTAGDVYSRLGAPAGASIAADIAEIEAQTDDIGTAGAGLTGIPWNAAWDAEVQSEVQDAIEANHLDHLLAADYDPASKPGTSTALLNELVENDGGVSRFTANALEQAPTDVNVASMDADVVTASALNADAVTEIWNKVCESEGSVTAQQIMSIILAVLAGETTNSGNTLLTPNGNATRVTATTASNERTAITLNPSS